MLPLTMANVGEEHSIKRVGGNAATRKFLENLGFVPGALTEKYHNAMEKVFGAGSCYLLRLREQGALRVI